eukprot:GHVU01217522.1.p1 GENE.GHVU01217522.1~~GHVU01217522.1.p1  ORF type:complete len:218 (+),score=42.48 GHVU01217522.1:254-907(+)
MTYDPYVQYLNLLQAHWSSKNAGQMLTTEIIEYLTPRFPKCSTPMKVRILMSFLYLPAAIREANVEALQRILCDGEEDRDDWVRKLSRLLRSYVKTGSIDIRDVDTETAFKIMLRLDEVMADEFPFADPRKPHDTCVHACDVLNDRPAAEALVTPEYDVDVMCGFRPARAPAALLGPMEANAKKAVGEAVRAYKERYREPLAISRKVGDAAAFSLLS